jgi:2-oxoglutarate dehydrogenase E1 component
MTAQLGPNVDGAYLEAMHQRWLSDPAQVPESWQYFFSGMAYAGRRPGDDGCASARADAAEHERAHSNLVNLIYSYRRQGHRVAQVNPLQPGDALQREALTLERWGLAQRDSEETFDASLLRVGRERMALHEIVQLLRETYCGAIGVEYMHMRDREARIWLERQMEPMRNRSQLDRVQKLSILEALTDSELFEKFTHSRYMGQKRFSLEGGETLISGLTALIEAAPAEGVAEFVIGMAHRGRLNVLANVMGMSYEMIFSEFEGNFLPDSVQGDGDVKYHKGYSSDWQTADGRRVHLSLTANPSHLEAVDPVVQGRVRAKQRQRDDTEERKSVVPLLIHGDAAFAGQGIVAETFNLSQLKGYRTGGTIHLVVNNQIGFTTLPEEGRSTPRCTDTAKIVEAPILHVNGDDPEAVSYAMTLALRYRQKFGRDVVVDVVGYRRHGHNEADDPAFTQPRLYSQIKGRPSVREQYISQLVEQGVIEPADAERIADEFRQRLEHAHETAKKENVEIQVQAFEGLWEGMGGAFSFDPVDTRVQRQTLERVAQALCRVPEGFNLNPKVARQLPKRLETFEAGGPIDWGFAELLSFGSLLAEGTPVRLSGQDSGRGTFSQRHAIWQDYSTQEPHIPLNHISSDQERFCVYNSSLSEAAVLGFEYGYALSEPRMLIMWEAQFGDFVNGAQVIVDQFITGAESKWQRDSGIVLLLPHGYEGQGPEHSSAYLERFLQGCAETNVQVCYPSTPAQYFHLLRRQVKRDIRLPLVVMTPKSGLRHKRVVSRVQELTDGGFREFLADPEPPGDAGRLLLCAGKVYWELLERREQDGVDDVAIVRVEQFYPFNEARFREVTEPYGEADEVVWVQEEPQNRGGWTFMLPRLLRLFPGKPIGYAGRGASASSATGSLKRHRDEQRHLIEKALRGPIDRGLR